jgi:hypothetical protein
MRNRDPEEERDVVLREIDGAIEALTELRELIPPPSPETLAALIAAQSESGSVLHHIGKLAQALDAPVPGAAI